MVPRIKFFTFLIIAALLFILVPAVYAQHATPSANTIPPVVSPTSPIFTELIFYNMFHTFSCVGTGNSVIGQPCLNYQEGIPILSKANQSGGVLGASSSLIGFLYDNPPVKTTEYLAIIRQDLGIGTAQAQGVVGSGEGVLGPVVRLWQVSRNVSYLAMIIIFVVIGLMVMFRQRINPQTVITAQSALPGLVLGLILITFSYFMAALISDLSFIATNLVGYYFSQAVNPGSSPQNLLQILSDGKENILTLFSRFVGIVTIGDAKAAVDSIMNNFGAEVQGTLRAIATLIVAQFALPFGTLAKGGVGEIISVIVSFFAVNISPDGILGFVLHLIAVVVLIYSMLKLLLRLIQIYLNIIFLVISAPFHFLTAALPGRQGIATNWILNMVSNALVFPAVLAVFYFVAFILGPNLNQYCPTPNCPFTVAETNQTEQNAIIPSVYAVDEGSKIVGTSTFPLFGGLNLDFIKILLAFGALVSLPGIPDVVIKTIGRAGAAGQILGQEYERDVSAGRGYYSQAAGTPSQFAGKVGNLYDQPYRVPIIDSSGKMTGWQDKWKPEFGHTPTMGGGNRLKYSGFGKWVGGFFGGRGDH